MDKEAGQHLCDLTAPFSYGNELQIPGFGAISNKYLLKARLIAMNSG